MAFARIIPIFHVKKLRAGEDSQGYTASVKQVFCLQNLALFFLILFYFKILQIVLVLPNINRLLSDTEYSSLCYIVGTYYLS